MVILQRICTGENCARALSSGNPGTLCRRCQERADRKGRRDEKAASRWTGRAFSWTACQLWVEPSMGPLKGQTMVLTLESTADAKRLYTEVVLVERDGDGYRVGLLAGDGGAVTDSWRRLVEGPKPLTGQEVARV